MKLLDMQNNHQYAHKTWYGYAKIGVSGGGSRIQEEIHDII